MRLVKKIYQNLSKLDKSITRKLQNLVNRINILKQILINLKRVLKITKQKL